jgi:hypothetical protein
MLLIQILLENNLHPERLLVEGMKGPEECKDIYNKRRKHLCD